MESGIDEHRMEQVISKILLRNLEAIVVRVSKHSSPTLHGSGQTKAADAEFEIICRRCVLPLAGSVQRFCTRFLRLLMSSKALRRLFAVTIVQDDLWCL
jgi:hypothetical protein